MKKTIIVNEEKGIFLGEVAGYGVFSKYDPIGIPSACGFDTPEIARQYMTMAMPMHVDEVMYKEIDTESKKYVPLSDIIKSGLEEYTYNMLKYIPVANTVH